MTASYNLVLDCKNHLGECPIWSVSEQALYWIDISAGNIFRWRNSKLIESWKTNQMLGSIMFHESGDLIACQEDQINRIKLLDAGQMSINCLHKVEHPQSDMRFNDGCCGKRGRIWVGSMQKSSAGEPVGELYRFTKSGLTSHLDKLGIPNGLAFSPDGRVMYIADTSVEKVWSFNYDLDEGIISNKQLFIDMKTYPGSPDGATVDSEGCYWICMFGGGLVLRFSPKGKLIKKYNLPVSMPTKCAFGGPNMDTLFVTSMRSEREPSSGGVFALHPGVQGLEESEVKFETV